LLLDAAFDNIKVGFESSLLIGGGSSMFSSLKRKLNPECYQGQGSRSQHFEGWYFKLVDGTGLFAYAVIPGLFFGREKTQRHAFIQFMIGRELKVHYLRYPLDAFVSRDGRFDIRIGSSRFSSDGISLNLHSDEIDVRGELRFSEPAPWPKTPFSPGIMGWYTWVPFMECRHGIVSMDHAIEGSLEINGSEVDFTGGRGYAEKDWGRSFPEAWVWFQSNHFKSPGTSLAASLAIIPWIRRPFLGFLVGLRHQDRLFRFTTYTGAKTTALRIDGSSVLWFIRQKEWLLEMRVQGSESGWLTAPKTDGMVSRIPESLDSTVEISLSKRDRTEKMLFFNGMGRHAGFEAAGNLDRLAAMAVRQWKLEGSSGFFGGV
jgi:tocopherol cyclase